MNPCPKPEEVCRCSQLCCLDNIYQKANGLALESSHSLPGSHHPNDGAHSPLHQGLRMQRNKISSPSCSGEYVLIFGDDFINTWCTHVFTLMERLMWKRLVHSKGQFMGIMCKNGKHINIKKWQCNTKDLKMDTVHTFSCHCSRTALLLSEGLSKPL